MKIVVFRLYGLSSHLALHLCLDTHDHMKISLVKWLQLNIACQLQFFLFPVSYKYEWGACMLTQFCPSEVNLSQASMFFLKLVYRWRNQMISIFFFFTSQPHLCNTKHSPTKFSFKKIFFLIFQNMSNTEYLLKHLLSDNRGFFVVFISSCVLCLLLFAISQPIRHSCQKDFYVFEGRRAWIL